MRYFKRRRGVSVLLACQDEEVTIGWSILSFLPLADEVIVVDNGSTDATRQIASEMARQHPEQVQFFDVPHLKDLYENRQYAFERSTCQWIVRADADYVCYTDGMYDVRGFREFLLAGSSPLPIVYSVIRPNVFGDFWHAIEKHAGATEHLSLLERQLGVDAMSTLSFDARIYRWFPGFRFERLGRWEGVRFGRVARRMRYRILWPRPLWMHCDIKSDRNYLFRSERTNWRELGDFERFPQLRNYLDDILPERWGTSDIEAAQKRYVEQELLPKTFPYSETDSYPYPSLVRRAMKEDPVYRIRTTPEGIVREHLGINGSCTGPDLAVAPDLSEPSRPSTGRPMPTTPGRP